MRRGTPFVIKGVRKHSLSGCQALGVCVSFPSLENEDAPRLPPL